ncbi:MAG TPA: class I SAM-dependent methyltransferase [Candidatus Saccharimonadales bacterium]|nr:class I SAM-dependent methyltransferase [Candidatus Saccharimonadales bacterium]
MRPTLRPATVPPWPIPFDPAYELDWGEPEFARRLLREHLDQSHDGASRRATIIARHVRRLRRLIPAPPSRILDAGCGPGLYAVELARLGHRVTGVDVSAPALRHARSLVRDAKPSGSAAFLRADLRDVALAPGTFDAALLVYYVIEAFPRAIQPLVLTRLANALGSDGVLIAEMRLRPQQPPGRLEWWDAVPSSLLSDRGHLLLGDSVYDQRRHTYVLRDVAVFDNGTVSIRQTSAWMCPFGSIPRLFQRGGLRVVAMYDGWTGETGSPASESVLVVARRRKR